MRISDWSSDVCSSDLVLLPLRRARGRSPSCWLCWPCQVIRMTEMKLAMRLSSESWVAQCAGQRRCGLCRDSGLPSIRSEEHTSELQSLMRISYAVFCLKKKRRRHITGLDNEISYNVHPIIENTMQHNTQHNHA